MFSILWNKKKNYPILTSSHQADGQIIAPRPVYFEELDLFGFNKFWIYPKSNAPLLWAIGRYYYYKGEEVAIIQGGSLLNEPTIKVLRKLELEPINTEKMILANKEKLISLENEAKLYISSIYVNNNQKHQISVAFSGGKDSQVILELVSQVIHPNDYVLIYTNTGMELPGNSEFVAKTLGFYKNQFPELKVIVAKTHKDMVQNWQTFGPPSRMQRWCCSVAKSIPYYVALSRLSNKKSHIVFEGVRREESHNRNDYERSASQVKHRFVRNERPIIEWNDTEVYLYLFYKNRHINPLYRSGLTRVGCSICPFSSDWSEYIVSKIAPKINDKYYAVISEAFKHNGIIDEKQKENYIKAGKWKVRSGDRILTDLKSDIKTSFNDGGMSVIIKNPSSSLFEWLKVFDYQIVKQLDNITTIMIRINSKTASYTISQSPDTISILFFEHNDSAIDIIFKKMLNKVAYCFACLGCVVECPVGAISFNPKISIDASLCTKCHGCINQISKGCYVASSRATSLQGEKMNTRSSSPDRYSTFGLRENWLITHFNSEDLVRILGTKQIPAVRKWLTESCLLEMNKATQLSKLLSRQPLDVAWGIIWFNLCMNSEIISWFCRLEYKYWDRKDLISILYKDYSNYSEGSLNNAFNALLNTLDSSAILSGQYGQGIVQKKGRQYTAVIKKGTDTIDNIVLIYALFKYSKLINSSSLTLRQVFKSTNPNGLSFVFGISIESLKAQLIALQEHRAKLLRVEFNANLDNVFLVKDLDPLGAIKLYLGE